MPKRFIIPVLELLVVVLVRVVNLFFRHFQRMIAVTDEVPKAVLVDVGSQTGELSKLLSSAADNSNLKRCAHWSRQ